MPKPSLALTFIATSVAEALESKPAARIIQPTTAEKAQSRIPAILQQQARAALDRGQAPRLAGPWAATADIAPGKETVLQREARKRALLLEAIYYDAQAALDAKRPYGTKPSGLWYGPDGRVARLYRNAQRAAWAWAALQ